MLTTVHERIRQDDFFLQEMKWIKNQDNVFINVFINDAVSNMTNISEERRGEELSKRTQTNQSKQINPNESTQTNQPKRINQNELFHFIYLPNQVTLRYNDGGR